MQTASETIERGQQPTWPLPWRARLARDLDGWHCAEIFLIAAVLAVLGIRAYLHATGYPQVGNGTLHIAHMLWGGLLMLIALLGLLLLVAKPWKRTAALLGGLGFGIFIDELGKFITKDNNYFFRPTVAIMYVIFVALFIAARTLQRHRLTPTEALLNAIDALTAVALGTLHLEDRRRLLADLRLCDDRDPLVAAVRAALEAAPARPESVNRYERWRTKLLDWLDRLARRPRFAQVVAGLFVLDAVAAVAQAVILSLGPAAAAPSHLSFVELGDLASSVVSGAFVVWGALRLVASRLAAYRWFYRAVLVSVFVSQFFAFAASQFAALSGLAGDLLLLGALHLLIAQARRAAPAPPHP